MIEKIAAFMDFDPNRIGHDIIMQEFNHKYSNSWIFIDKELILVDQLFYDHNEEKICLSVVDEEEIHKKYDFLTLEAYLPKTGLYQNKTHIFYLKRLPQKQWVKSLSFGKNYALIVLEGKEVRPNIKLLRDPTTEYKNETAISAAGNVYLHWKKIGVLTPKGIELQKATFKTEMEELWQQYPIILAAKSPRKPMAENLQVPF